MMHLGRFAMLLLLMFISVTSTFSQQQNSDTIRNSNENLQKIKEDSSQLFTIRNIYINGNRKTKEAFIFREIPFKSGEQYPLTDLVTKFEYDLMQLKNTSIFHEVVVAFK
jgi:outer membrane protein assembly factor BamA